MKDYMDKLFIVEGILLLLIGVMFFMNPLESLIDFTILIGVLMIASAILKVIYGWQSSKRLYMAVSGIVNIIFGGIIIFSPISTLEMLVVFFGVWALIRGLFELVMGFRDQTLGINFRTFQMLVAIGIGVVILLCPLVLFFMMASVPYLIGAYFVFLAGCELYTGWQIGKLKRP